MKHLRTDVSAAVLAGGESTRMGQDKALLPINGRPMIELIASTMSGVFGEVCIISDRPQDYRFLGLAIFPDIYKESGPMGGIHAALSHLSTDSIFAVGCDTPFITRHLVEYVLSRRGNAPAAVARMGGNVHPLCGVYAGTVRPVFEDHLRSGRRKMRDLLSDISATIVPITADLPFYREDLLANVNDRSELARYTARMGGGTARQEDCGA